MTTETTTTNTQDLEKLTTQANELRGAMVTALGKAEDNKVRQLGNELAQVNRQILDIEVKSQGSDRDAYRDSIHDALNLFEFEEVTLTVKFNAEDGVASIAFEPTKATISAIKAAVASIARPSSAIRWTYGRDEQGYQAFDFGSAQKRTSATTGTGSANGTRTVGWTSPSGADITLGDAFDACATAEEKAKLGNLKGGSATNAHKVLVVTKAGYKKN